MNVGSGSGSRWGFNGDLDRPTFTPSVLVTWRDRDGEIPDEICHTFITAGRVLSLSDCTHTLAGQTLPRPDLPPAYQDSLAAKENPAEAG